MVETIAPVVHGGRNKSYWLTVAAHTFGATLSGALFGALLGGAGRLLGAPWGTAGTVALALVAGVYLLREAFRLPVPLPDLDKQVPDWWRTFYSPPVAGLLYGLGLGIGFLTFLTFGTYVAVAVGAVVSGDALFGALLLGLFGCSRGLSVLIAAGTTDADGPASKRDALEELYEGPRPRLVNGAAVAAIALGATTVGLASVV
jgi:hypothetical protein